MMPTREEISQAVQLYIENVKIKGDNNKVGTIGLDEEAVCEMLEDAVEILSRRIEQNGQAVTEAIIEKLCVFGHNEMLVFADQLPEGQKASKESIENAIRQNWNELTKNVIERVKEEINWHTDEAVGKATAAIITSIDELRDEIRVEILKNNRRLGSSDISDSERERLHEENKKLERELGKVQNELALRKENDSLNDPFGLRNGKRHTYFWIVFIATFCLDILIVGLLFTNDRPSTGYGLLLLLLALNILFVMLAIIGIVSYFKVMEKDNTASKKWQGHWRQIVFWSIYTLLSISGIICYVFGKLKILSSTEGIIGVLICVALWGGTGLAILYYKLSKQSRRALEAILAVVTLGVVGFVFYHIWLISSATIDVYEASQWALSCCQVALCMLAVVNGLAWFLRLKKWHKRSCKKYIVVFWVSFAVVAIIFILICVLAVFMRAHILYPDYNFATDAYSLFAGYLTHISTAIIAPQIVFGLTIFYCWAWGRPIKRSVGKNSNES